MPPYHGKITNGLFQNNGKLKLLIIVGTRPRPHSGAQDQDGEMLEFEVSGEKIEAVHMLPGYTSNIINLSETEDLATVMRANEPFDPTPQDIFAEPVRFGHMTLIVNRKTKGPVLPLPAKRNPASYVSDFTRTAKFDKITPEIYSKRKEGGRRR